MVHCLTVWGPDEIEPILGRATVAGLQNRPMVHSDGDRPAEPGVYVFYDISERPIYVGESDNIKRRVRDHEDKFWFKRPIVETASYIVVNDKANRKQLEQVLIKFLKSNAVINKQHVER